MLELELELELALALVLMLELVLALVGKWASQMTDWCGGRGQVKSVTDVVGKILCGDAVMQ